MADITPERSFSEVRAELEDIVSQVRDKDTSLEKSLDLFEEAIRLGNDAFELIDRVEFSSEEDAEFAASDPDRLIDDIENGRLPDASAPVEVVESPESAGAAQDAVDSATTGSDASGSDEGRAEA